MKAENNIDFIRPAYVCRPGGVNAWTVKEAKNLHKYLLYLSFMQMCYGENIFNGLNDINPQSFNLYLKDNDPDNKEYDADICLCSLFKAAWDGNVVDFATYLYSPYFKGEEINAQRQGFTLDDKNISLLEAALCGGSREIVGVIITHKNFDLQSLTDVNYVTRLQKRSYAFVKLAEQISIINNPLREVQRHVWHFVFINLFTKTEEGLRYIDPHSNKNYIRGLDEYYLGQTDFSSIGVDMHLLKRYPSPVKKFFHG